MSIIIRQMRETDREQVAGLYLRGWQEGYKGLLSERFLDSLSIDRFYERQIKNGFLKPGSFVYERDGAIAAHCRVRPAEETNMKGWGEIHTIYVLPDLWRQGIGAALLGYAKGYLREQGMRGIYLYVLENNSRARSFYAAQGFIATEDRLLCDLGGETVTDIRMLLEVRI